MSLSAPHLDFPVIAYSKDGTVLVFPDLESLTTCSPHGLRTGYYDRLRLLAVDGRRYIVKSAKKARTKKRWWMRPMALGTLLTAKLDIEEDGMMTLEELKQALLEAFKHYRPTWKSQDLSYQEFAEKLEGCRSFREVRDCLAEGQAWGVSRTGDAPRGEDEPGTSDVSS